MKLPIADLHCDLLSYLQEAPHADPLKREGVGSNIPAMQEGNVKLQVLAIYTSTAKGSTELAAKQSIIYKNFLSKYNNSVTPFLQRMPSQSIANLANIQVLAAIENASGFCEEDDTLEEGFKKLEKIISNTGQVAYIGFTHHGENRFGGGNATNIGLKSDGKALLEYMNEKKIPLDFSHTSDALAYELLNCIAKYNFNIPVLASHSNFRAVFNHPRNLPDDIAKEIILKKGVIGINFLRAFLNDKNPNAIFDHIEYGLSLSTSNFLCFGADFFYTDSHPDQSRKPFFYPGQDDSSCYPALLEKLSRQHTLSQLEAISHKNALDFFERLLR